MDLGACQKTRRIEYWASERQHHEHVIKKLCIFDSYNNYVEVRQRAIADTEVNRLWRVQCEAATRHVTIEDYDAVYRTGAFANI